MTPKEKALQLVEKFKLYADWNGFEENRALANAKQCAIIAVEEILNAHLFDLDEKEYWQQVKTEIENL